MNVNRVKTIIDDAGAYTYIGEATNGTASSDAKWTIERITNANPKIIEVSAPNQVFDDRASGSYA